MSRLLNSLQRYFKQEADYDPLLHPYRVRADRVMVAMNAFLLVVCCLLAPLNATWMAVLLVGVPTLLLSIVLAYRHPGSLITRLFMAAAFMVFTGLIIHQNNGDIEAHFSAFGLIGILLYYRDWRTILVATVVIYLHHLLLGYAQTLGLPIYIFDSASFWSLFFIHVAYFLPFVFMMSYLASWLRREGYESQRVIAIAQEIIKGNLIADTHQPDARQAPLIHSVLRMKNHLLDLLRVLPAPAAVMRVEDAALVNINDAWERQIGPFPLGARIDQCLPATQPNAWENLLKTLHSVQEKRIEKQEIQLQPPEGPAILCEVSAILHEESHPMMAIVTLEDITQRREAENTLHRLAFNDLLTGLPNRTHLQQQLQEAFTHWQKERVGFAVLMLDLDGFKPINDTYGHDAGDQVLRVIGQRLQALKQDKNFIARLGGDEFVLLIKPPLQVEEERHEAAVVINALAQPIQLEQASDHPIEVKVGTSIGIAHIAEGAQTLDELLKQADIALYFAKKAGKCQAVTWSEAQRAGNSERAGKPESKNPALSV